MDSQPVKDPSQFRFTWRIDRFSKMNTKKLYSGVFEVGGYKWRGLIFPKGNNVDYLSMYLDVANSALLPNGWSSYALFSMTVVNQITNNQSLRKDTHHKFNEQESDWGFTSFIPLGKLHDPRRGYLVNDTLIVEVEVTCNLAGKDTAEHLCDTFSPSVKESKDEESLEEQNQNITFQQTNIEAQQSKEDIEMTQDEGTSKDNTSKFVSLNLEEIDAMIDEDVIAAIDRVLSEGITLPLQSQHSVQGQEVPKLDPNLPEQLLEELRDIAFKENLVEKFKEGFTPKVNFNAVKEKIDANADAFSSHQLEQVGTVVNLVNNIARMFEKLENLKKDRDSAKRSTDQDNEALKETRQKILTSKTSFTDQQTQLNSLDAQIADLKAKRDKIADIQDQEKDKITSLNKEVKSIFHRLVDDQIKLKSVEDKIPEAQTELESHEKLYQTFRAVPPF